MKAKLARYDRDHQWVGMHPHLARVYLTALADELAGATLRPTTDTELDHLAVSGLSPERLTALLLDPDRMPARGRSEHEVARAFAFLALESVIPKNLDEVTVEQILKTREELAGERGKFQEVALAVARSIAGIQGEREDIYRDHLEVELKNRIKPELDKLRDALQTRGVDVVKSALNVRIEVPVLTGGVLAAGGVLAPVAERIPPPLLLATGAALFVTSVVSQREQAHQQLLVDRINQFELSRCRAHFEKTV